ncbi:MAG: hypothetical protein QW734_07925 [Candidatus Bathyarchaeia archaeon]
MAKVYVLKRPMKKASKRLKLMGLNPKVVIYQNEGYMFIPLHQIIDLIKRKVVYPNVEIYLENNQIVVRVWKETKPQTPCQTSPLTTLKK